MPDWTNRGEFLWEALPFLIVFPSRLVLPLFSHKIRVQTARVTAVSRASNPTTRVVPLAADSVEVPDAPQSLVSAPASAAKPTSWNLPRRARMLEWPRVSPMEVRHWFLSRFLMWY